MIRTAFALGLALSLCTAAQAQEAMHPVLKAHATVSGDLVKIGDLVENAGMVAKVAIFRAPDLGTTGTVSADAVAAAVAKHALIGLDTAGLSEVTVRRPARTIPAKEIEGALAQALASRYQLGTAKDVAITFDGILSAVHVDPSALGEARVTHIAYDPRSGRFDAMLDLPTAASTRGNLHLAGRAVATTAVVTLAHAVERGAVLKDEDIVVERRPRADLGRDVLSDPDRVRGLALRSNLQTGSVLRAADVIKPEIVLRNEAVTITYAMPGLMLTVRGKALEGGAQGDTISVLNEQSKRTLQGIVTGPGHVTMGTAARRLAANLTPVR
jgi:flagellar basal body P-ring formation protein FlgA